MFKDFETKLNHRAGGARLGHISVYHDFKWADVLKSKRGEFKNGKRLALLVKADCPVGKSPALILTTDDDAIETTFETDTHYVSVVRIKDYLQGAIADPAASYYARKFGKPTRAAVLKELEDNAQLRADLIVNLNLEDVAAWVQEAPARRGALLELLDAANDPAPPEVDNLDPLPAISASQILAGLKALDRLDLNTARQVARLLKDDPDPDALASIIEAVSATQAGRSMAQIQLALRLADRLRDLQLAAAAYSTLLDSDDAGETELHDFIKAHPWLLGLDYIRVRAEKTILRGRADFLVERYDGFHDLLELKDPRDSIIDAPDANDDGPPSATTFSLSPGLSNALAQAHVYRRTLTSEESAHKQFGLTNTRDPQIFIVIGRGDRLPDHRRDNLIEFNKSLHRVTVLPFDWLAERAQYFIANLEKHLASVIDDSLDACVVATMPPANDDSDISNDDDAADLEV